MNCDLVLVLSMRPLTWTDTSLQRACAGTCISLRICASCSIIGIWIKRASRPTAQTSVHGSFLQARVAFKPFLVPKV